MNRCVRRPRHGVLSLAVVPSAWEQALSNQARALQPGDNLTNRLAFSVLGKKSSIGLPLID